MPTAHAEKDNREGEKINCLPLVLVSVENLWCHVHRRAKFCAVEASSRSSSKWCREPEVDNFNVEFLIE